MQISEVTMRLLLAASAVLLAIAASAANAQQQQTPPCTGSEFHQMDFWLGEWNAYYTADTNRPPDGHNTITREYGGCVVQEQFDGGPQAQGLIGHSVSTYHAPSHQWRQTWVDNQGGYFALIGGVAGGDFILTNSRINDAMPYQRMVYTEITPTSFTWRWQSSADAGATWTDAWVIHYVRRAS
jgi:opacity protein-like surface antigen